MQPSTEIVVVHRVAEANPLPGELSDEQEHDLAGALSAVECPARRTVLETLCVAPADSVAALARRLGQPTSKVSGHLSNLKLRGLVRYHPDGKHHRYEPVPGLVHYQRTETETTLRITARGSGVAVTISIPIVRSAADTDPMRKDGVQ